MITQRVVGERYAQALLEVTEAQTITGAVAADLEGLSGLLRTTPALTRFLETPQVTTEDKRALLRRVLASRVSPVVLRLIDLLLARGRIRYLAEVAEEFQHLYRKQYGVQEAMVLSATPIPTTLLQRLTGLLERLAGRRVEVRQTVDASLIGGVLVRMDHRVIDGSIRRQLTDLAASLSGLSAV